jgi:DNA-binding transcriptional ArsR family regulator
MSVTLTLPETVDLRRIRLVYGPLPEAAISVHILTDPKHHPLHAAWVRRCRSLPNELRQEFRRLRPAFACGLLGFLCPTRAEWDVDIAQGLRRLEDVEDGILFYELAYATTLRMDRRPRSPEQAHSAADAILRAAAHDDVLHHLLSDALNEPRALLERIARFLQRYWDEAFQDEWLRIRPTIDAAAGSTARTLSEGGLPALLRTLSPEVLLGPDKRTATLARPFDLDIELRHDSDVEIHVSYYLWPHVWVSGDPNWPLALAVPTTPPRLPASRDRPRPELVRSLRALGDPTRLNLLRIVADEPRSTQELARLLNMSEPGISRHLTTLARAGLVRSRREGHYVVYNINQEALEPLAEALLGYISPSS